MNRDWQRVVNERPPKAQIKTHYDDFQVTEVLPIQPSGSGEHLWITVRKIGHNTQWVASLLSKWCQCPLRAVSYAGLKDRHAVTTQTFSVHLPGQSDPSILDLQEPGVEVLSMTRHLRKIKTGQLIGNEFRIRLRQVAAEKEWMTARFHALVQQGVPNYFTEQRFGRDGQNVAQGIGWLTGKLKLKRHLRSICLSSVRSFLFNCVLEHRVIEGSWDQIIPFDFMQFKQGKTGFYLEQAHADDYARLQSGQISACASLPGLTLDAVDQLLLRENQVLSEYQAVIDALIERKVKQQFRKLRVFPEQARIEWLDKDPIVSFFLPAGSYATAILREWVEYSYGVSEQIRECNE